MGYFSYVHTYLYNITDYVHSTGLVTHTLLCEKCGYIFVSGTHKHSFETTCQACIDIISQYNDFDKTIIEDDEAKEDYRDSTEISDDALPKPVVDENSNENTKYTDEEVITNSEGSKESTEYEYTDEEVVTDPEGTKESTEYTDEEVVMNSKESV